MSILNWFTDSNGHIAGATDNEGYTYDEKGNWTGRVKNGEVYDKTGSYMGKISSDGEIRDKSGRYAGKVRDDGWVEDRDGHLQYKK